MTSMVYDAAAYKQAKEAFVADNPGTTPSEILLTLFVMPGCLWLYSESMAWMQSFKPLKAGQCDCSRLCTFIVEFAMLVLPTIVVFLCPDLGLPICLVVYSLAFMIGFSLSKKIKGQAKVRYRTEKIAQLGQNELPILTLLRAQLMLSASIAILAVDFTIFPRRFAKTETFGFSLMDVAVGLFIVSSGAVSHFARSAALHEKVIFEKTTISPFTRAYLWIRPIFFVVVCGLIRLYTTKAMEYQEHHSEYGVHWNFFFTLSGVYIIYSVLRAIGLWAVSPISASIILIAYEIFLTLFGGSDFIMNAPRTDLFTQNREGILSLFGSVSLYAYSVTAGSMVLQKMSKRNLNPLQRQRELAIESAKLSLCLIAITWALTNFVARPSRRMVNASYVMFIMTISVILLSTSSFIHLHCKLLKIPRIFLGTSRNQLCIFLLANLLTGAVNMSMYTIYASSTASAITITLYMIVLCWISSMLEYHKIRIRL